MKSLLEHNTLLQAHVAEIAEVAGYLYEKGWAERNGGNITVNVTDCFLSVGDTLPALTDWVTLAMPCSALDGQYFFCKGTNRRMRDLARHPMQNGAIIRLNAEGTAFQIVGEEEVMPTSELPAHLTLHNYFVATGSHYRAVLHTHPTELVALSHHEPFLEDGVLTRLLWSMIPETRAFCPKGLGITRYEVPGSEAIALATLQEIQKHDVALWAKHGVVAVGEHLMEAFDQVDVFNKSALIYQSARNMGFVPQGMTQTEMDEMANIFGL